MKYVWKDLPKPASCFTTRNTTMFDLRTNKTVQHYSANTKIAVVQKCVTTAGSFYRTASARDKGLDWAFKAPALGLPNEVAPLVRSKEFSPKNNTSTKKLDTRTPTKPVVKQTPVQQPVETKDGGSNTGSFWSRLLTRRHKK